MLNKYIRTKSNNFKIHIKRIIYEREYNKNIRHLKIDVKELFLSQRRNEQFNRYDIVVRYLAIENYYNKNNFGFALYKKMQELRNPLENSEDYVRKFKELIASFENRGYDITSEIETDKEMLIEEGAHRVSCALYFGIDILSVKVLPTQSGADYSIDWFFLNGFTDSECNIILEKERWLREKNNSDIAIILWPTVYQYYDEIMNQLKRIWEIIEFKDVILKGETFERAVNGIYFVDDINGERIKEKILHVRNTNDMPLRIIRARIESPRFRLKKDNGHTLLIQGEKIKKIIRNIYKNKIDNYYFDYIIHTADNFYQSEHILSLFFCHINLDKYFSLIKEYKWILIKLETDYVPDNFPKDFAFSKDIDIVCPKGEYRTIIEKTKNFFCKLSKNNYEICVLDEGCKWRLRVEKNQFLIFQVDISYEIEGLQNEFLKLAIENRVLDKNYYVTKKEYEICFRVNEYMRHSSKKWHLHYIENNIETLEYEILASALGCSQEKCNNLVKELIKKYERNI